MTIRSMRTAMAAAALAITAAACESATLPGEGSCDPALRDVARDVDGAVRKHRLEGGLLLVMQGDQVLCELAFGGYDVDERVLVASASKWMTAVALLTLVDEGRLSLDEPISRWLPEYRGDPVTLRQLLSHTSGLPNSACLGAEVSLRDCAGMIAQDPRQYAAGTRFLYAGGSFTVAGALAEAVAGEQWALLWRRKVHEPLGFTGTFWRPAGENPLLSGGAYSTLRDYAKMMRMILAGGELGGRRVLSAAAIEQMRRNSIAGLPVAFSPRNDAAGYSLGAWIDAADAQGRATELSSVGASGFLPWLDFDRNLLGIVVIPPGDKDNVPWYTTARGVQADVRRVVDEGI